MYFDFIKNTYPDIPDTDKQAYIDRDKKALASIIKDKTTQNVEEMVERWYKLTDIGVIPQEEKFLDLLKEAEQLYTFGFYTGTIAIIGIACEEYCRYLMTENKIPDTKTQDKRIDKLSQEGVITSEIKDSLHNVRKLRNNCMHYNVSFKQLTEEELEHNAFDMITLYKTCLQPVAVKTYDKIESDLIADVSKKKNTSFKEYLYKHRNMLDQNQGINLQIHPDVSTMSFSSVYYVCEIDISESFQEMTLFCLEKFLPLVVDLTLPQCEMIKSMKLEEGNLITASVISAVSTNGHTEEWLLLKIEDVSPFVYDLEQVKSILKTEFSCHTSKV